MDLYVRTPRPSCSSSTTTRSRCTTRSSRDDREKFGCDTVGRRLAALPAGGALPERHRLARAGWTSSARSGTRRWPSPPAACKKVEPRTTRGDRRVRHGRHAAVVQRRRDLPVAAAARAATATSGSARSARCCAGCRATSRPSARTAARSSATIYRRYDGADLEELNRIVDEILAEHVLRAAERRRRATDPRAPRRRAPDGPDHRRDPAADPAARAAVRRDRRRRAGGRRPTAAAPASCPGRRSSVSPGPRGSSTAPAARTSTCPSRYAYADSHSDLPMLRAVGNPVAVSPDVSLFRAARAARWQIVDWKTPSTSSRLELPGVHAEGGPMMLALEMYRSPAKLPGGQGGRRPHPRHPDRSGRAAAARHDQRAEGRAGRAGRGSARSCPASAAPTSAR